MPESPLLYKIGDVAEVLGLEPHIVRYWEKEFKAFLRPIRIGAKKKLYDRNAMDTFEAIRSLIQVEGYTAEGARKRLREGYVKAFKAGKNLEAPGGPAAPARESSPRTEPGAAAPAGESSPRTEPGVAAPAPEAAPLPEAAPPAATAPPEAQKLEGLLGHIRAELLGLKDYLLEPKKPGDPEGNGAPDPDPPPRKTADDG
ncbi:MAG: MerR family transcriptional regulator [Deltaproteobacteria bacterium]|nr:MerR family transcriptional regulator [Deltaproteobacteria bacterium]